MQCLCTKQGAFGNFADQHCQFSGGGVHIHRPLFSQDICGWAELCQQHTILFCSFVRPVNWPSHNQVNTVHIKYIMQTLKVTDEVLRNRGPLNVLHSQHRYHDADYAKDRWHVDELLCCPIPLSLPAALAHQSSIEAASPMTDVLGVVTLGLSSGAATNTRCYLESTFKCQSPVLQYK